MATGGQLILSKSIRSRVIERYNTCPSVLSGFTNLEREHLHAGTYAAGAII